jgi:signal transduction histidine kinase
MTSDPARAQEAIERVQDTGRHALGETRRLVEALRDPVQADRVADAPTWPDIPDLVRRMRDSGLPVTWAAPTREPALTPEASAAAYRVVQEALTNALRHAGESPTSVEVTEQADLLVIDVQNEGVASPAPDGRGGPPGFGLPGMQERIAACGGMLTSGPRAEGGFRVRAVLPLGDAR